VAYKLINGPIDWTKGINVFYLGLRKKGLSSREFLKGLSSHIKLVAKNLKSKGLNGYWVIANEKYEVAYMNFKSKEAMAKAFASNAGKEVIADGAKILKPLMWLEEQRTDLKTIKENSFYRTVQ
jgi:hypothetical protein